MKYENKHKFGLDIIRIASMFGILLMHILGKGGLLENATDSMVYWRLYFLEIVAFCSVNVFGILSGYLGYGKNRLNSYRVFELLCSLGFYSLIVTVIFLCFYRGVFQSSYKNIVISLLPFMGGNEYWYIICYIPIAIIAPYINFSLEKMDINSHKRLCIILIVIFSIIQSVFIKDLFYTRQGYSIVWLIVLYILGAYIRRTDLRIDKKFCNYFFVLSAFLLLFTNIVLEKAFSQNIQYLVKYISPVILIMAVCFFVRFKDIVIREIKIQKLLKISAIVTFDIYIIHSHPLIYNNLIRDVFSNLLNFPNIIIPEILFLTVITIYLLLTIFGLIRYELFTKFNLQNKFEKITKNRFSYSVVSKNENIEKN